jgi:hypothetical protein
LPCSAATDEEIPIRFKNPYKFAVDIYWKSQSCEKVSSIPSNIQVFDKRMEAGERYEHGSRKSHSWIAVNTETRDVMDTYVVTSKTLQRTWRIKTADPNPILAPINPRYKPFLTFSVLDKDIQCSPAAEVEEFPLRIKNRAPFAVDIYWKSTTCEKVISKLPTTRSLPSDWKLENDMSRTL